jgi:maleate cis-trans isomerase
MFEDVVPKYKVGCLAPLSVIGNEAYEFYRIAPPGILLFMIPIGLSEFSQSDADRVFEPLLGHLDQLKTRDVDLIIQNGVPLQLLLGPDGHDRLVEKIASHTKVRSTTSIIALVNSLVDLSITSIVVANKWSDDMNETLKRFVSRANVSVCGVYNKSLKPKEFIGFSATKQADLAWELGRRALLAHPEADALYIGGGNWMSKPVCCALEDEFMRPVICNETVRIRHIMRMLGVWTPIEGHGRVLQAA